MRVKVRCVAKRRDGVHILDGAHAGVLPGVDGVCRRGWSGLVGVFPPKLHIVVLVVQHGIRCGACTPTVAAYAGMSVEPGPWFDFRPCIVLAAVPGVLKEGGVIGSEPDVL